MERAKALRRNARSWHESNRMQGGDRSRSTEGGEGGEKKKKKEERTKKGERGRVVTRGGEGERKTSEEAAQPKLEEMRQDDRDAGDSRERTRGPRG